MDAIVDELREIDLGDVRLNRRSQKVLEGLHADTQASINGAFDTWSDTLAAYRLFNNTRVTPEAILTAHVRCTEQRIHEQPAVLILQDTTELDFSKHPPRDAGCLTKPNRRGLYCHTHLAVTPAGLPLGLVGNDTFDRTPESLGKTLERRDLPIEQKESFRWLQGYRLAHAIDQACPDTHVVNVADCEADMYDIFLEAQAHQTDYVIRSKENRLLNQRIPPHQHDSRNAVYRKLRDETRKAPVMYETTIELTRTPQRAARTAKLEVRSATVTLHHPKNRRGLAEVDCQIVYVQERTDDASSLPDNELIEWWLLTSLPVTTRAEVEQVIAMYRGRWKIEEYFRVLKTGCRAEQMQLETIDRVKTCLAFYQIIAWYVIYLAHLNRHAADEPCTVAFRETQWQVVWRVAKQGKLPKRTPTLGKFLTLLATFGGYNNRKTEPPPGSQPLWIGLRRMHDFVLAWQAFNTA